MRLLPLTLLLASSLAAAAQQPPLTADQQTLFTAAKADFAEHHPDLALEKMKQLHAMVPDNPTITVGTAETAVTLGDDPYALSILQPWTATHPDDSFALELLARAYAETGATAPRDQALATLLALHQTTADPSFKRADRFLAEHIKLPEGGALDLYYALVPFSGYHIYMLGRQVDANNALVRQITLESNDIDQVGFAKDHPDRAAKGERRFSIDTYTASKPDATGTPRQTQALLGFLDGKPTYDETKARMLKAATNQTSPTATRSGLPLPPPN